MKYEKNGKFFAQLRKEKNMTQQELAEYLHYSDKTISRWENGISLPDSLTLDKLSNLYNVSIPELVYGERLSKENKVNIEKTLIKDYKYLLNKNKTNKKVILLSTIIIILLIILLIFIYIYFNYIKNTVKIYNLISTDKTISTDSTLIITNDISILNISPIENSNREIIKSIKIYQIINNKEKTILYSENKNNTIREKNGFGKYDLYKLEKNDIYIDIEYEDNIKTIKLKKQMIYSNKFIIPKKIVTTYNDNNLDYKELSKDYINFLLSEGFVKKLDSYEKTEKNINITINKYYILLIFDNGKINLNYINNKEYIPITYNGINKDEIFYLKENEIKNCKKEKCSNSKDYAMYVNYYMKKYNELNS